MNAMNRLEDSDPNPKISVGLDNRKPSINIGINRRQVLKLAGGVLASGLPVPLIGAQARRPKKVIIAGGGIAGLCCAYELMKRGHEVTVLEASGRTGGHVKTIHDPLADGLYADVGAEHFTQPSYDLYWNYSREFNLPVIPYPRRDHMIRFIQGKMYTEETLADPAVLKKFELNQREIDFLAHHRWWEFPLLYYGPYLDNFKDEYRPFDAGLNSLDQVTLTDLLKKDGASAAALSFLGGSHSALHALWWAAIRKLRGIPLSPPKVFRIKGGNQMMTDTFASKLGERVRLGCPVTSIEHGSSSVTVQYREFGEIKKTEADYLVSCMSLVMLRQIPVMPNWPEDKAYPIRHTRYYSETRVIFQSRTPFWTKDGLSPNMEYQDPNLTQSWRMAEEVNTTRGLLVGTASGVGSAEAALATFRKHYPGKSEDIEAAHVIAWPDNPWASACETVYNPPGELAKFWPKVIEPHGRIHFAGAYADNLNRGMEAATRSANRVAAALDAL